MEVIESEAAKQFWRWANLTQRIFLGPLTPRLRTPSEVCFMWGKVRLLHTIARGRTLPVPILIVPPLMVRPEIFDLRAGHSFVNTLAEAGFDVFLLDFGVPDKEDRSITVKDYVDSYIADAVEKMMEASRARQITMLGWSMGGIMIYLYASLESRTSGHRNGVDSRVRNIVTLGSPVDYARMFPFNVLAKLGKLPLKMFIGLLGNIPPFFTRNGFRLLSPVGLINRYMDLLTNYWDKEWVAGFESINDWVDSFIPYPGEAFKEFVQDFIIEDRLKQGSLIIDGKKVDLKRIHSSILAFVGTQDKIARAGSVDPIAKLVSSKDILIKHVPLGHIGLVAGGPAPSQVWEPCVEWLLDRSN